MNIAVDIRPLMDPIRTGVGEYVYELLDALFKIDKQNQYFLFYNSSKDVSISIPEWKQENVHYVGFNWPNKIFNLALLLFKRPKLDRLIVKKLGRYNNATMQQCNNLDYFFSPNISFTSVSKECKNILTIHDLSFEYFSDCFSFKRRLWHKILNPKKACHRADIILTPSENTKRDVIDEYKVNADKIKVVYPGLSSVFAQGKLITDNWQQATVKKYNLPEKFILFLGTLEPRKNITGLIEAFKKFYKLQAKSYKLVIAGAKGWKCGQIMKLIDQTEGVQYIGYVEAKDKPGLYKLAHLFVYPSLYEGFGFPVLEAMSMGTPIITSNRSSMPEIVGDCAYLVNSNNIDEIARGMELLSRDENMRNLFSVKGIEMAKRFSWDNTAKEFLNLISS